MSFEYADVTFRFLTDPQAYSASVPDNVDLSRPEVAGTVMLDDEARDMMFQPHAHGEGGPGRLRRFIRHRRGVQVNVFRPHVDPPRLIAVWKLKGGLLSTWMPLADSENPDEPTPGKAGLNLVIDHLSVTTSHGYPLVKATGPRVKVNGPKAFTERDTTQFFPKNGSRWPVVQFTKLSRASAKKTRVKQAADYPGPADRFTELYTDTPYAIRVRAFGPMNREKELREVVAEVADSLTPVR
ncbi:MAG: hypothetical protein QOH76_3189 [Thermoleophilaceae bacterium]|jgi:hypothetical protein|nr:hypothetical protein [Thermoleophilaceae bacterium]